MRNVDRKQFWACSAYIVWQSLLHLGWPNKTANNFPSLMSIAHSRLRLLFDMFLTDSSLQRFFMSCLKEGLHAKSWLAENGQSTHQCCQTTLQVLEIGSMTSLDLDLWWFHIPNSNVRILSKYRQNTSSSTSWVANAKVFGFGDIKVDAIDNCASSLPRGDLEIHGNLWMSQNSWCGSRSHCYIFSNVVALFPYLAFESSNCRRRIMNNSFRNLESKSDSIHQVWRLTELESMDPFFLNEK